MKGLVSSHWLKWTGAQGSGLSGPSFPPWVKVNSVGGGPQGLGPFNLNEQDNHPYTSSWHLRGELWDSQGACHLHAVQHDLCRGLQHCASHAGGVPMNAGKACSDGALKGHETVLSPVFTEVSPFLPKFLWPCQRPQLSWIPWG